MILNDARTITGLHRFGYAIGLKKAIQNYLLFL